jgi:hypothetical protein
MEDFMEYIIAGRFEHQAQVDHALETLAQAHIAANAIASFYLTPPRGTHGEAAEAAANAASPNPPAAAQHPASPGPDAPVGQDAPVAPHAPVDHEAPPDHTAPVEQAAGGGVKGVAGGAAAGAVVGAAGALALGPAAPVIGALAGAYVGSLAGGLSQIKKAHGPDEPVPAETPPRQPGLMIAVCVSDAAQEHTAVSVLRRAGGLDLERAAGSVVEGRWHGFDPLLPVARIAADTAA